jgi:hypothetical protein
MTVRWMIGSLVAGVLLALAAVAAEPVAAWFRLPRRWIWAAAMAGAVMLPLVAAAAHVLIPPAHFSAAPPAGGVAAAGAPAAAPAPRFSPLAALPGPRPLPPAALVGWMAASLATLATLAWAWMRVGRACGRGSVRRVVGTRVLVSEGAGPMVLGVLDPLIVLPRWVLAEPETCRMVVRHEREHVAAGDPWLLAVAALAVVAMPWSPALWWMHARLRLAVETDCDQRVLWAGESRRGYVDALLDTAGRREFRAALAWGGRRSMLERRLRAITAPRPRLRVARALPLAVLACAGAAAACRVASDTATVPEGRGSAGRNLPIYATPGAPAPLDTTVVIEELPDGALRASFGVRRNKEVWTWTIMDNDLYQELGFTYRSPDAGTGAYPVVETVAPASPVQRAGLRAGDRIVTVNGKDARLPFRTYRRLHQQVTMEVRRREAADVVTLAVPAWPTRAQVEQRFRAIAACMRDAGAAPGRGTGAPHCVPVWSTTLPGPVTG